MLATCSPISSEGNELLVQFVSDLSVTADGFSASYKTLPRGAEGQARSPGEDARLGTSLSKPGLPSAEKPKASSEAQATPGAPGESGKGEEGDAD